MKIRTIIAATCAALAFSMAAPIYAHDSEAQNITKNFEAAIPNVAATRSSPWRSITRRARPFRPTPTRSRLSSTPMGSRARSSRR